MSILDRQGTGLPIFTASGAAIGYYMYSGNMTYVLLFAAAGAASYYVYVFSKI